MNAVSFIDFEASFMISVKGKVSENAPKNKII